MPGQSQKTSLISAALLGVTVGIALPAHAEIPQLSREFRTERYITGDEELAAIRAQRRAVLAGSGGTFQVGDAAGSWNPLGSWKRIGGGRIDAESVFGRYTLGASGVADSRHNVEADEFEQRVYGTAYVPEARVSVTGVMGFEDGYAGFDVALESLLLRYAVPSNTMDLRPRIWAWTRFRKLDGDPDVIMRPAVGAYIQHAIVVGSQATLGATVWTDVSESRLPLTALLLQMGWAAVPRPLTGVDDPGPLDPQPSPIRWNWFAQASYAAPLDTRGAARLVVQAGARFVLTI